MLGATVGFLPGETGGSHVPRHARGESTSETPQVMNCLAEHLGGWQNPLAKRPGALDWPVIFPVAQGEGAAGEAPSPASQSTVRHLIVPVPTVSLAWIYAVRGHLWRDSNNMTLLAFLFLL